MSIPHSEHDGASSIAAFGRCIESGSLLPFATGATVAVIGAFAAGISSPVSPFLTM